MAQNDEKPENQELKPPAPPPAPPTARTQPNDLELLKQRLSEAEKHLALEREKVLRHDLRTEQEAAFSSKVEASLKDIQQKLQRDKRERELDEERAELKQKLRDLESKLISERETWVQVMKSQLAAQPQPLPQQTQAQAPSQESALAGKLAELSARWEQERLRLEQVVELRQKPAPDAAADERLRAMERRLDESTRMADRLSEMERKLDTLRSEPRTAPPAPEMKALEERLQQARLAEAELQRQLSARAAAPVPPPPPPAAISVMEQRLSDLMREKEELGRELSSVKETLSRLEKQGSSLDHISQVILAFKESIAQSLSRPMPMAMPGGNIVDEVLTRERKLDQAQAEIKELKSRQDTFDSILRSREEAIIHAQAERDERVSRAEEEKLKAITELVSLKKMVSKLKPINAALEREYARAQAETARAKEEVQLKAAELEKLSETNTRIQNDITDINGRLDEKTRRVSYLETELARIREENEKRVQELEGILKEQSQKYSVHLEELESERGENEKKLAALDAQKARLEKEYKARVDERDQLKTGLETTAQERQQLNTRLEAMQQERASLAALVQNSVRQVQELSRNKSAVDLMLHSLQSELARNTSEIKTLNGALEAMKDRNQTLEGELNAREDELARQREAFRQARRDSEKLKDMLEREAAASEKLKRKIEYYEKMAHNALDRFKWAMSGKKPE